MSLKSPRVSITDTATLSQLSETRDNKDAPLPCNDCGLEMKLGCACQDNSAVRSDCTLTQKRPPLDTR